MTPIEHHGGRGQAQDPRKRENAVGFEILRALRRIIRRVSKHSRALSQEGGLTVPQLVCLKAIAESNVDPMTVKDIGARISLSPATVSRVVDRLVRKGLAERHRWETDRRKVYVVLTAAGIERYETLPAPLDEKFLHRLAGMPEGETASLLAALERIVDLMDAKDEDAAPMLVGGVHVEEEPL